MKKVLSFIAVVAVAAMAFTSCKKNNDNSEDTTSAQAMMQGWWEGTLIDMAYYWTPEDEKPWNAWTMAYKGYGNEAQNIADIGNQDFFNIVKEGDKYVAYKYHNQADAAYTVSKIELTVKGDTFVAETDYPAPGTSLVYSLTSSTEITEYTSVSMDASLMGGPEGTVFFYTSNVHFKKSAKPSWADQAR